MSTSLVTASPDTTAKEAAELLVANGITTLPVVDAGGTLVGIVTDADLIRGRIGVDPRSLVHAYRHRHRERCSRRDRRQGRRTGR